MSAKPLTLPSSIAEVIDLTQRLEPPRPLIRELPPADPFPVEALGENSRTRRQRHKRPRASTNGNLRAIGSRGRYRDYCQSAF
jgi:hypothetical protein